MISESTAKPYTVVGVAPWLPWPLSAWNWWTVPVPAERLAMLRIGVTLCLLADISLNYAPETLAYYGQGGLGDPAMFNWRFEAPRTTWSLLRGVGDGATLYLSLAILIATTCWIFGNSLARLLLIHKDPPRQDRTGMGLILWTFSVISYVAGIWSRMIPDKEIDDFAWVVPLAGFSLSCLFVVAELACRLRDSGQRISWTPLLFSWFSSLTLLMLGILLWNAETIDPESWWVPLLKSWQDDETLLTAAMIAWALSAILLGLGCCTRVAAVSAWLLSMSFANANPYLDNAGDTIRLILLFYLMLCPCGATWSVDALFKNRPGPVYVHPWPLRLIFVQMIFIYFMNGLYKLFGVSWLEGDSLYFVLGDAALTRVSQVQFPIPHVVTKLMTWSVLAWEVSFPVMVLWKWPRRITLCFGVLFHLGIFATMELGGFVPYALCMYLPLLPWERLRRARD